MSAPPEVVVLVTNWNGRAHLEQCLPSLEQMRYRQARVVVLDNASQDDSLAWVSAHHPRVEVTRFARNLGFTGANNAGLASAARSGARYAVLLNNDTRVDPDWLDALVAVAESDRSIALCAAQQRTWDGAAEVRFRFIPQWAEAETFLAPLAPERGAYPSAFASGCALLVRLDALATLGAFDERYFAYVEDVDLSLRAWISGYRVMAVPAAIVYHWGTGSSTTSRQRMFWGYRNQLTTLLKVYERDTWRQFWPAIRARWVLTRNRVALDATMSALGMLPNTLRRRRAVQDSRQRPDDEFLWLGDA